MAIRRIAYRFSFTLFPGICVACGLPSGTSRDLCRFCEEALPQTPPGCHICADSLATPGICGHCLQEPPAFSRVVAPFVYEHPVDRLIQGFKYRGDLAAGAVLSDVLARHLETVLRRQPAPDRLVPVPLHWTRLCRRGYNQAREIAVALGTDLGIPVADGTLRRRRRTPASQGLDRARRLANLRRAFQVRGPVDGLHLALVDDVVTSTATARTLSALLKRAGAREVEVWCLARTPLEK